MHIISVRGARTHNLKNINFELPRNKLIVITGLSGSGKSSLAFDTLYAEGQRRYVESLSTYARQFLSMMEKPDVDHIEGLSPAIAIEQKSTSHNPRSTVGTVTEIYDYLRVLYARVGEPHCPKHDVSLAAQTVSQMVDQILALPANTKIAILAPIVQNRKGEYVQQINNLQAQGFMRARINGVIVELDKAPKLALHKKHTIEVVVDRLLVQPHNQTRITDSLETALNLADGLVKMLLIDSDKIKNTETKEITFSAKFACPICDYSIAELEPRIFSFNNPIGACSLCDGLGVKQFMDIDKIIYDPSLSLAAGAIRGWNKHYPYFYNLLEQLANKFDFDLDTPFKKLSKKIQKYLLYGVDGFEGIIVNMERRYRNSDSLAVQEELAKYLSQKPCNECCGSRLNVAARHVYIQKYNLPDITAMSITQAYNFFKNLKFTGWRKEIAQKILKEIYTRLEFLLNVGLEYLTLSRNADTLSGGEAQRIRLASQIGAGLVGVMYVLDEPSIGLHQRDNERLIKTLNHLKNLGNTVIVVEHDEDAMRNADHIVDMGPGAGIHGGEIIAQGNLQAIINNPKSLTGKYLAGKEKIAIPENRTPINSNKLLILKGVTENNLKNLTVKIPIGVITCITGVSGSGKSSLLNDTLYPIAAKQLNNAKQLHTGKYESIMGLEYLDKVVEISQSPIGRTPRSNPATYTGLFTEIRELFASTQEARSRGYKIGRFSFNVKGGRCEACKGDGLIKVEMHFLADVYVPCDICNANRYNRETLEILYKGKNIYEVLDMTIEEALIFFQAIPSITRKLDTIIEVGLGYLKLGQSATTLSGGEAQRVKLAKELARKDTGRTLYILDEPTTGLHFHDVKRLIAVLQRLQERGNTIIIIEHNLDVIKIADWIIDLGPEGGSFGGEIIAEGTPEQIVKIKRSYTGKFLKPLLYAKAE